MAEHTGERIAQDQGSVRRWLVGGAILESADRLVLVRNLRRNGRHDWSTPGGVIEPDEDLLAGLRREVAEETGLEVRRWSERCYEVRVHAVDLDWVLRVEVHRSEEFTGELRVGDDPDGIVVAAEWATHRDTAERLASTQPWVREPLLDWLEHGPDGCRQFGYVVLGTDPVTMTVERVAWEVEWDGERVAGS